MNAKGNLVPWFRRGDIGGISYAVTNNIVNYLIVIATLTGVLGWPDEVVFGYVVPGMSIGLMLGCFYYAWMGWKLSKREGRADVTALPSGVSTPAMFVILYGVISPLSYAIEDPMQAWAAAMAITPWWLWVTLMASSFRRSVLTTTTPCSRAALAMCPRAESPSPLSR